MRHFWTKLKQALVVVIIGLVSYRAGAETPETACWQALADFQIIRDARVIGWDAEQVKQALNEEGPYYEDLLRVIDEAYAAVNVDAWYQAYYERCVGGLREAASSRAINDETVVKMFECTVRAGYALDAIKHYRRGTPLPAIPAAWSDEEKARIQAIYDEAAVWPRGEMDFVDYVLSGCYSR